MERKASRQDVADMDFTVAMMKASESGNEQMIAQLLIAGANQNTQDEDGSAALMHTSSRGHSNVAKLLMSAHRSQVMELLDGPWIPISHFVRDLANIVAEMCI